MFMNFAENFKNYRRTNFLKVYKLGRNLLKIRDKQCKLLKI